MSDHECVFVEEQEPSGRLILPPCIGCDLTAMDAIENLTAGVNDGQGNCSHLPDGADDAPDESKGDAGFTAHASRPAPAVAPLAASERESLAFLAANRSAFTLDQAYAAVERIAADRLAAVKELADEWSTPESHRGDAWIRERDAADRIRAALDCGTSA